MSRPSPIPLSPRVVSLGGSEFQEICGWDFPDSFVARLLVSDVPQRVNGGNAELLVYVDPNQEIVGFGTLDICLDYAYLTNAIPHPYIPLLAVNPAMQGLGHGDSIIRHLTELAAFHHASRSSARCHELVFLDGYTTSQRAMRLYDRNGFVRIDEKPVHDPAEGRDYFILPRNIGITRK